MLTNIFESRNKTFLNLVKLGDYLARSLRENVELFSVDNGSVTYLTESGYIVRGDIADNGLAIQNLAVDGADILEDSKLCNKLINKKITLLMADILENDLHTAQNSFDGILNLWETKLNFDRTKKRLAEKSERFNESLNIINTPQFQRLIECKNELVKVLKESDTFISRPEVRSTVKLSSIISKSFNIPRITLDEITESGEYKIPKTVNHTLYDHLCKQELVSKELFESKQNFDTIWITNDKIQKLPSFIYESNENVMQLIAEIVTEIPYFAMATKKQLNALVEGNLDLLTTNNSVTDKDIKEFVGKIFEFKKPVKTYITKVLNEKYGVNVQNLTATPTFDSLIKTQTLIFEAIARISPKNSNLRRALLEFSDMIKTKTGVESIDVTDLLSLIFEECEYSTSINETSLLNYLNFSKVADDLGKIGQVLKMIQAGAADGGGMEGAIGDALGGMGGEEGMEDGQMEPDGGELAGMGGEEGSELDMDTEENPMLAGDPEEAAMQAQMDGDGEGEEGMEGAPEEGLEGMEGLGGEEEGMEGMEGEEEGDALDDGEVEFTEKDDLIDNLAELEDLIATLKGDLDLGDEGGEEFGDEEGEVDIDVGEEGASGEEDGDVDINIDSDDDEGESEEEEAPKKKSKPPFKGK
jgi:hypothetical protein